MKVFLSWSGERSKEVAEAFRDWLPQMMHAVVPWMSKSSIEKGARSAQAIADELEDTKVGIVCLTGDNLAAPWLLFESGAIAKTKDARVCTFLLDIKNADVEPPLGQSNGRFLKRRTSASWLRPFSGAFAS
jgi:hypothetical protein